MPQLARLELNEYQFTDATEARKDKNATISTKKQKDVDKLNENTYETPANNFDSSYSNLESINDDCLCLIYQYLNIMDVVNVSATCRRLLNFAKAFVFPKKAKQIAIRTGLDEIPVTFQAPLDNQFSSKITLQSLERCFSFFGDVVEDLRLELQYSVSPIEKADIWQSYMIVMEHCQSLRTLHFKCFEFDLNEIEALKDRIEKMQDLKELKLFRCPGITSDWPAELTGNSKVEKLTLCANTLISRHFFEYFRNVSSLSIDFDFCKWQIDDYVMIFDHIGNSLKHLEIIDKDHDCNDYQSISVLITEKLPNLKSLTFNGTLTDSSMFIIKLPNLKSLHITAVYTLYLELNLLMRTLSDIDIIEDLMITSGFYADEGTHLPQLNFNRLQCLRLNGLEEHDYSLMKTISRSHMPEIHSFEIKCNDMDDIHGLLNFFDSKKTFKTIRLSFGGSELAFLRQIIEILIKPCMPKRPFINLQIHPFKIGGEELLELLSTNRSLIKVEKWKDF